MRLSTTIVVLGLGLFRSSVARTLVQDYVDVLVKDNNMELLLRSHRRG